MKALSLKINKEIRSISILSCDIERAMLHFIFGSFGALAVLYVFLLGNMVSNIVQRRTLELNARTLSGEVRDLELTYLSMSGSIDLALSHSMGFKETKVNFATRKSLGSIKTFKNDI